MKLALSNIAWELEDQEAVAELMAKYGVTGVEIAPSKIWSDPSSASTESIVAVKDEWTAREISVSSMQALLFGHPEFSLFGSDSDRQIMLEYIGEISRVGGLLGARPLVFGSPKNRLKGALTFQDAKEVAVPFFRQCGDHSLKYGTLFCIEPNPPQYGCDFMTNSAEAIEVVEDVAHPAVRLHLDSGIMTLNAEDPTDWIERAKGQLAHFHISEPNLAVIGTAGVRHSEFASALREIKYQGWCSIEMRPGWNDPNTISVEQALQTVAQIYGGD